MIKTLLVDDDALVRMFLRQMIVWEDEGCTVIGDARDGEEALAVIAQEAPDLIITDISMPVMDGVTLIRRLRAQQFAGSILVLSCHEDFQYVKDAMQLGADDYILKNHLKPDTLREALRTSCAKLRERLDVQNQRAQLQAFARKGRRTVQQELLESLLHTPELAWQAQYARTQAAGLHGQYRACIAVLARLPGPDHGETAKFLDLCLRIDTGEPAEAVLLDRRHCAFLLDVTGLSSAQAQTGCAARLCAAADNYMQEYLNLHTVLGVSAVCVQDGAIARAILQAGDAAKAGFYGPGTYWYGTPSAALSEACPPIALAFTRVLPQLLEDYDPASFQIAWDFTLDAFRTQHTAPRVLCDWLRENDRIAGRERAESDYAKLDCFAGCADWLARYTALAAQRQDAGLPAHLSCGVRSAVQYLREHFTEPIGLTEAAGAAGLTAPYLSALFKREMEVGFSEYLTGLRLGRVKQQLVISDQTIKQIAQNAGFADYQHFCKVFRKREGVSPAAYRRMQLEGRASDPS